MSTTNTEVIQEIDAQISELQRKRDSLNTCWVKGVFVDKDKSTNNVKLHTISGPTLHYFPHCTEIVMGEAPPTVKQSLQVQSDPQKAFNHILKCMPLLIQSTLSEDIVAVQAALAAPPKITARDCLAYLVKEMAMDGLKRRIYSHDHNAKSYRITISEFGTSEEQPDTP